MGPRPVKQAARIPALEGRLGLEDFVRRQVHVGRWEEGGEKEDD